MAICQRALKWFAARRHQKVEQFINTFSYFHHANIFDCPSVKVLTCMIEGSSTILRFKKVLGASVQTAMEFNIPKIFVSNPVSPLVLLFLDTITWKYSVCLCFHVFAE